MTLEGSPPQSYLPMPKFIKKTQPCNQQNGTQRGRTRPQQRNIEDGLGDSAIDRARDIALAGEGLSGYCTVMMQQIPFDYMQADLLEEIHGDGFEGTYDFFFLPLSSKASSNLGFAFINFLSPALAEAFYHRYCGQRLKHFHAPAALHVIPAGVQGFVASVERFFAAWQARKHFRKRKSFSVPVFLRPVPAHLLTSLSSQARDALEFACGVVDLVDTSSYHLGNANPIKHDGAICYSF